MSDWQPQVVQIESVSKHPDADALDVCVVLGDYPVITKRDEYKTGDLAQYIPIDTIVPDTVTYYFLSPKGYDDKALKPEDVQYTYEVGKKYRVGQVPEKHRIIKAKKLRGIYSQGLLMPLQSGLGMWDDPIPRLGDLLTDPRFDLGLKKWEEPEEENLPGIKKLGTNAEKAPHGWTIPHYDIDGVRKYLACLGENEPIVLTEKIHGSNAGFSHDGNRLWVKSRNYYKKQNEEDMWWDIALRYDLENKLAKYPGKVFFGEVYGQVKGFRYDTIIADGRLLTKVRFFDIWDTKAMRYLNYDERVKLIMEAELDPVPELYRGPWLGKDIMYPHAEGMSTLNPKHVREGWVLNTLKERYEERLKSRMQVKLVGEGYNLQK